MKKIMLIMFLCVLGLTGCNKVKNEVEDNILMCYSGTYSKYSATMGTMTGGHLLYFYNDNTLDIYAGFNAGIGDKQGVMKGTYSIENNIVEIDYIFINDDNEEVTFNQTFEIKDDSFRTQIYLFTSQPDDATDQDNKGLTYNKIEVSEINKMSSAYIGVKIVEDKFYVYVLELKQNKTFVLSSNFNTNNVIIEGEYEIVIKGIDDPNEIEFTYLYNEEVKDSFVYDSVSFEFNIKHTLNDNNDNVSLIKIQ